MPPKKSRRLRNQPPQEDNVDNTTKGHVAQQTQSSSGASVSNQANQQVPATSALPAMPSINQNAEANPDMMQFMSNFAVAAWRSWTSSTATATGSPAVNQPMDSAVNPVTLGNNLGAQAVNNMGQMGNGSLTTDSGQRAGNMGNVSGVYNPTGGTSVPTHGALHADSSNMDTDPPSPPSGEGGQQNSGALVPSGGPGQAGAAARSALEVLTARNLPGNKVVKTILSHHVTKSHKSKIWEGQYDLDLGFLLDKSVARLSEDQPYQLIESKNDLKFSKTPAKIKIENWTSWNKAWRIFTEIAAQKDPLLAIDLVQYAGLLNNLIGKFDFQAVYDYDVAFRQQQVETPAPWFVIDTQLWSIHLQGGSRPAQASSRKRSFRPQQQQQNRSQSASGGSNFRHCFDFNGSGCSRARCFFPHCCSLCGNFSHNAGSCPSTRSRSSPAEQVQTTNSNQSGQATKKITQTSRQNVSQ